MAVERAWITIDGKVLNQLTDEQMNVFTGRVVNGLSNLAYLHVLEEVKQEKRSIDADRAVSTASCQ